VNRAQKEAYKRDYAQAKAEGKPFFPYAVYKDLIVASIAIGIVIALAIWQRVEVGEPVNPASTDFVPRPEWYFFFLFELLRIFKGQNWYTPVIMATFIVPNILMVLLLATPFIDRGPERRIWKRPIALVSGIAVIIFLSYMTYLGANAPEGVGAGGTLVECNGDPACETATTLIIANGCLSCHTIAGQGGNIGPDLTNEASRNRGKEWQIQHLKNPQSETPGSTMPPFSGLQPEEYEALATFLEGLGTQYK
jgi:quinol-cytochrome oxidoreductase complex cytochrome b subunit